MGYFSIATDHKVSVLLIFNGHYYFLCQMCPRDKILHEVFALRNSPL